MENNLTMSEEQKNRLGDKYITEGTSVTDNDTQTKYRIKKIEGDGILLEQVSSFSNHPKSQVKVSFEEFLQQYDNNQISVGGYSHEGQDPIIFHQVVKNMMSSSTIGELETEETDFNKGGMSGKMKYKKSGVLKDVKNKYGKSINEVMHGGTIYKKDLTTKSYKNEEGNVLTKEHGGDISLVKKSGGSEYKKGSTLKTKKDDIEETADRIVSKEIYVNQNALVEKLLKDEIVSYDDIQNLYKSPDDSDSDDAESEPQEVLEWWLISDWLKEKLLEQNEPILDTDYGVWWGRTTSGQMIQMDGVIQKIAEVISSRKKGGKAESTPDEKGYQGWKNYETWNVKLWIDNDEGSQSYWDERATEIAKESKKDEHNTKKENAAYELSLELKDYFEENNPLSDQASTYSDLLGSALDKVYWSEIAENLLAEKMKGGGEMKEGGKEQTSGYADIEILDGHEAPYYREGFDDSETYRNFKRGEVFKNVHIVPTSDDRVEVGFENKDLGELDPNDLKITWHKKEEGGEVGKDSENMNKGGRVEVTKNYYRVTQDSPKGISEFTAPKWTQRLAETTKSGSKIVTAKKGDEWYVKSIMIPKKGIKASDAKRIAEEIKSKISRQKEALGGVSETATEADKEKTKRGLKTLISITEDKSEKKKYQELLNDLN